MRNPPAAYKHDDPTHRSYGESADSSLLAKRQNIRQNFAGGGPADYAGADYVTRKAAMSPSDIATYQKNVSPAEFQYFMNARPGDMPGGGGSAGQMSPGAMLDKMGEGTNNPSIQQTKDLASKFGIDLNAQSQQNSSAGGYGGFGPTTTITQSGPVTTPWGGTAPASQTNTYNAAGQNIGPKI